MEPRPWPPLSCHVRRNYSKGKSGIEPESEMPPGYLTDLRLILRQPVYPKAEP